jgi:hypothetical protein
MSSIVTRPLPEALASSNEFKALNSKQAANFSARLGYVAEVIDNVRAFLSAGAARTPLHDFLDDLELDATSANVFSTNPEEHQSNYLIHTSWTFECSPERLANEVGRDLLMTRSMRDLVRSTRQEVEAWLADMSNALTLSLSRFYAAPSFCTAVAHLLMIDALMAELLAGLIRLRFNGEIQP